MSFKYLVSKPCFQPQLDYLCSRRGFQSNLTNKCLNRHQIVLQTHQVTGSCNWLRAFSSTVSTKDSCEIPSKVDVCIIGGGAMGSSVAYWLKQKMPDKKFNVVVIEKDPSYKKCSTVLSLGGVRQQFSLEENIRMSMFGADFLRNASDILAVDASNKPNINFNQYGYLFMASQKSAAQLEDNWALQTSLGAKVELLTKTQLQEKFRWINAEGVDLACFGLDNEGWFDPESLLHAFRRKAISLGAKYIQAETVGFEGSTLYPELRKVVIKTQNGDLKVIEFDQCVISAGHASGKIASLAQIGKGEGVLATPLPVEPRKRYVYGIHAPNGPRTDCPLAIDPTGTYFRREGTGGLYLCGQSPTEEEEPPCDNFDVDFDFFEQTVWPILAHRVPAFENVKLKTSWVGYYDYNSVDQNGIFGPHPFYQNLFFTCGFSGHGIQQSPAAGRATMELLLHQKYQTIDLTRFHFDRFVAGTKMLETNIV